MKTYKAGSTVSNVAALLICVLFAVFVIYLLTDTVSFAKNAEKVEAEIVSVSYDSDTDSTEKNVYVSYEYDGQNYSSILIKNDPPSFAFIGDNLTLYIDSENPTDVRTSVVSGTAILFILVFVLIIVYIIYSNKIMTNRKQKKKNPYKDGTLIMATVDEIIVYHKVEINYLKRQCIKCSYYNRFTGERYEFISDKVWEHLDKRFTVGDQIPVYVMPNNYSKYYVDIEYLPSFKMPS